MSCIFRKFRVLLHSQFIHMKTKRIFIGIFGRRNQGKSSLINALAGQELAIVSDIPGTTTDPVKKSIEIFGIGPAVLVDTAGIDDDETDIGRQRVRKSLDTLSTIDAAILVLSHNQFGDQEEKLIHLFQQYELPFVLVHNKSDKEALIPAVREKMETVGAPIIECSSHEKTGLKPLIQTLTRIIPKSAYQPDTLLGDLVSPGDTVVLVMPQDSEAPEGRLILPQVQVIRDLLDHQAVAISLQPEQLPGFLQQHHPKFVVTDSQVFATVSGCVPPEIPLTSFSIVLARAKGHFNLFLEGTTHLSQLQDGDRILMMESCTHVTSCEDIGRHKIPTLLQKVTGKKLQFDFVSALSALPDDLSPYAMGIQCGGCMVTQKQLHNRVAQLSRQGIPVSNYGMTIAYLTGIFDRVTAIFKN